MDELEAKFVSAYRERSGEELVLSVRKRFSMLLNGVVTRPVWNHDKAQSDGDEILFFQLAGA
jgi:molybdopterin converting factor small subunit